MSLKFKNRLRFKEEKTGGKRRRELAEKPLDFASIFPETVEIEDIDSTFKKWCEENIVINFEGQDIPTVSLFTNQRFSEYMQSWKTVDDKKNFLMNFKVITRENNPKKGTLYGDGANIPGERKYTINRYLSTDENGRNVILDFKMKQPYCIDIQYKLSVVTNKIRLLNKANEIINDKFKAITSYLNVKGHFMPMNLGDISDESDYQIDDREYFSQTFSITVKGYIINGESFEIEEKPLVKYSCIENEMGNFIESGAEIEEGEEEKAGYKSIKISIPIKMCKNNTSFTSDSFFIINRIETENILRFDLNINQNEREISYSSRYNDIEFPIKIKEGDYVCAKNVVKENNLSKFGKIILYGYEPYEIIEK